MSQYPENPESENEGNSDHDSKDVVTLPYATICGTIKPVLKNTNIICNIKKEVQTLSNVLEGEVSMNMPELPEVSNLTAQISAVSVFNHVSLATMAKAQNKDYVLGLVIQYVYKGDKAKGSVI